MRPDVDYTALQTARTDADGYYYEVEMPNGNRFDIAMTMDTNPPGVHGIAGQAITSWYRFSGGEWARPPVSSGGVYEIYEWLYDQNNVDPKVIKQQYDEIRDRYLSKNS